MTVTRPATGSLATQAPRLAGNPVVRRAAIGWALAVAALVAVLAAAAGLSVAGWVTGLAAGWAATALIITARLRSDEPSVHPADWATLARAVASAGVTALVATSFSQAAPGSGLVTALVTLCAVALALDAVDGQVARRTGTATALGGIFDGEVDAYLILVLSVFVSRSYGGWVLVIGAARYALLLAGRAVPWLAATLPPRYWRKVVCAVQGIVLTVAASGLVSHLPGVVVVAVALALLAESFGHDVAWLYRKGAGKRSRLAVKAPGGAGGGTEPPPPGR